MFVLLEAAKAFGDIVKENKAAVDSFMTGTKENNDLLEHGVHLTLKIIEVLQVESNKQSLRTLRENKPDKVSIKSLFPQHCIDSQLDRTIIMEDIVSQIKNFLLVCQNYMWQMNCSRDLLVSVVDDYIDWLQHHIQKLTSIFESADLKNRDELLKRWIGFQGFKKLKKTLEAMQEFTMASLNDFHSIFVPSF